MRKRKILHAFGVLCLAMLALAYVDKAELNAFYQSVSTTSAEEAESSDADPWTGKTVVYDFDSDPTGELPPYMFSALTGEGEEGIWVVMEDETAPSPPNVLAQISTDPTNNRFPLAILKKGSFKDLDLSVKFKAVSGTVDQAGGLVFRYQDENNYYLVRANALEDNYRLYRVVDGIRQQFAGADFAVTANEWHTLGVVLIGNQFECYYDGELKITASDDRFPDAGNVGLWTKADSVTHFDDLTITRK